METTAATADILAHLANGASHRTQILNSYQGKLRQISAITIDAALADLVAAGTILMDGTPNDRRYRLA